MYTQNYTKLSKREKKFYSISDLTISSMGINTRFLTIAVILVAISILLNCIIALGIGNWYFSPFKENDLDLVPLMIIVGVPIGLAAALFYIKLSNYRLIDFLLIYLRPKDPISFDGKKAVCTQVKIDAFLENQHYNGK
jgi:hypothetical protein